CRAISVADAPYRAPIEARLSPRATTCAAERSTMASAPASMALPAGGADGSPPTRCSIEAGFMLATAGDGAETHPATTMKHQANPCAVRGRRRRPLEGAGVRVVMDILAMIIDATWRSRQRPAARSGLTAPGTLP